jgi:outer membrane protein
MRLLRLTLSLAVIVFTSLAHAQTDTPVTTNNGTPPSATAQPAIPSAPMPASPSVTLPGTTLPNSSLPSTEGLAPQAAQQPTPPGATPPGVEPRIHELPNTLEVGPAIPADAPTLTLAQAEQQALIHNPRIDIAHLLALAQGQATREQQAAFFPTLAGAATAVDAVDATRLTAGALNNPTLYSRAAFGATLNQLLTDFGRTRNLVASASLRTQAADSTLAATRFDIFFAVDAAFYRALGAQALIGVAQQTVATRRTTANQIGALTNARLRSTLDLSFANADLAQAQLQLLDARNASIDAQATLSAILGDPRSIVYRLVDETPRAPTVAPLEAAPLVDLAFKSRPDLRALQQTADAQHRFASAESDLSRPSINALGAVGDSPEHASAITSNAGSTQWYGAVGVNVTVPIFNGFLSTARADEARLRASAADSQVTQLRETIARDVTTTVLQAQSNFNRIAVAQQLAEQSDSALQLAQTRYNLGLSSIVELSQAQLLQTEAQIQLTSARYAYQGSLAAIRYQTGQ